MRYTAKSFLSTCAIGAVFLPVVLIACNTPLVKQSDPNALDFDKLDQEYFPDGATLESFMNPDSSRPFKALSQISVPKPSNSSIINQQVAVQLGKAFFWDVQVSGDGKTACATCHASGGVDKRQFNIVHPLRKSDGSLEFEDTVSGINQYMNFDKLLKSRDPNDNDDHRFVNYIAFGSPGVARADFVGIKSDPSVASDNCNQVWDPVFQNFRQVTDRNSPSMIGAVFNRQQFWDGRANEQFNGLNPFGFTPNNLEGSLTNMGNSSLASQAVGPVNSSVEMSCKGRGFHGFNGVGAKLLARQPLQFQKVAGDDSVLGSLANAGNGLNTTYPALINQAFSSSVANDASNKFSLIWGEAIQAYISTLIPDQTPFDRWLAGAAVGSSGSINRMQLYGFEVFRSRGNCLQCHGGTELTDASVSAYQATRALGRSTGEDGADIGYHNIGNTPPDHPTEIGRNGKGPGGTTFAENKTSKNDRAFKTPGLRNIKLTGPYFHNGRAITLHDVLDFYEKPSELGFLGKDKQVSTQMKTLSLSTYDHQFLEDFLKNALTDCRTEKQQGPFDHPSLPLPLASSNGDEGMISAVGRNGTGSCP
jgi:cytochrome c peroxidase